MPLTGPYTKSVQVKEGPNGTLCYYRRWYRTGDHVTPAQYDHSNQVLNYVKDMTVPNLWSLKPAQELGTAGTTTATNVHAQNRAIAQFQERMWDSASVSTTLAEWEQSCSMIAKRALQLTDFVKALKRGRFGDAWAALGITKVNRELKSKHKRAADLWLELHFGWEPLIYDIGDAIEVLQGPRPPSEVEGRGVFRLRDRTVTGASPNRDFVERNYKFTTKCCALVAVENPNQALANQMGFVNPLSVAWELVPYSFVVDWFLPVGGFLNSFTSYCGLSVTGKYTTNRALGSAEFRRARTDSESWYTATGPRYSARSFSMHRDIGVFPQHRLVFNELKPPSLARAATQISLLIGQLRR